MNTEPQIGGNPLGVNCSLLAVLFFSIGCLFLSSLASQASVKAKDYQNFFKFLN